MIFSDFVIGVELKRLLVVIWNGTKGGVRVLLVLRFCWFCWVIILSLVRKNEARKHAGCDEIAKISALKAKTSKFAEAAFFEGQKVVGGTVGVYNLLKKDFTDVS